MSDAITDRRAELEARKTTLEAALAGLTTRLADVADPTAPVAAGLDGQGMQNQQRVTLIQDELKRVNEELCNLPDDRVYEVAESTDVVGGDSSEYNDE